MKCLTVRQPWADAIIHGGKNIENRSQLWKYRGPVAIHAAGTWSVAGGHDARVISAWCNRQFPHQPTLARPLPRPRPHKLDPRQFPTGVIIGLVDLTDAHHDDGCCRPWGDSDYRPGRAVHLQLENPRPLAESVPWAGVLDPWRVHPIGLGTVVGWWPW